MKNKVSILNGIVLLLLVFSLACSKSPLVAPDRSEGFPTTATPPSAAPPKAPDGAADFGNAGGVPEISDQRMIVRSAEMSLVVKSVTEARDQIAALAENKSGFVVSSSVRGEGQDTRGSISIRVPDQQFQPTLADLRKLGIRVESESTNSQDVTEQYTDLQARLKNAQATETQYVAILSRANTVEDTLKVYQALSQVRQQIEQLQGQIQYLERTTSMSLINIQLRPEGTPAELITPGWSPLEVLKSATRSIISFGQWLVDIVIWIAIFSPVWGLIIVIAWFVRRKARRQRQNAGVK